jgi:hypothetical protein
MTINRRWRMGCRGIRRREKIMAKSEFRGPVLVELDRKALMRMYAKKFYKEISKPGLRAITFVIECEDAWNIQSSHADDCEAASALRKASSIMEMP